MAGSEPSLATEVHVWQARLEPGAAHGALRGVLSRYLDEDPAAIELRLGERGKPMLADPDAALHFNLSHSGGLMLIAVCRDREVGVDVQRMRKRRGRERPAEFYAEWTRREAIAKCHGVGLWAPLPDAPVTVSELAIDPGYAAAIAIAGETMPAIERFEWPPGARPSVGPAELAMVPGGGA